MYDWLSSKSLHEICQVLWSPLCLHLSVQSPPAWFLLFAFITRILRRGVSGYKNHDETFPCCIRNKFLPAPSLHLFSLWRLARHHHVPISTFALSVPQIPT